MIQIITTLFTLYTLSSSTSRLLLQQPPMYIPVTETPIQQIPPVTPTQATIPIVVPPVINLPSEPPLFTPVVPIPPVQPQPVINLPSEPPLFTPVVPIPPVQPQQPQSGLPPPKIECKFSPPNPNSCSNKMTTITDPDINFDITCSEFQSCMGSHINIVYSQFANPWIESFKGLWFTNENSGQNAVIKFVNNRPGNKILIDQIKCDKPGSCQGMQIITGDMIEIEIGDFHCAPQACTGCVVKEFGNSVGKPCFEYTEPI